LWYKVRMNPSLRRALRMIVYVLTLLVLVRLVWQWATGPTFGDIFANIFFIAGIVGAILLVAFSVAGVRWVWQDIKADRITGMIFAATWAYCVVVPIGAIAYFAIGMRDFHAP
jgi:hypothetical protein